MKFDWRSAAIMLLISTGGVGVFAAIVLFIDGETCKAWGTVIAACVEFAAATGLIADW